MNLKKIPSSISVIGDTSYRNKGCPSETAEIITFFQELEKKHPELRKVSLHVKNEGKRNFFQARMDKACGLTTGACDIIILTQPALLIELKRRDHTLSKTTDKQINFLQKASDNGCKTCFALGASEALKFVDMAVKNEL